MRRSRGFTLIELIAVICIIGIVATLAVQVFKYPMEGYLDSKRRAEMDYVNFNAKTAFLRELGQATPGSVRITGAPQWLEFVPMRWSGRYRAQTCDVVPPCTAGKSGDKLDTTMADTSFDTYVPSSPAPFAVGDYVTLNSGSLVYSSAKPVRINSAAAGQYSATETNVVLATATLFTSTLSSNRFHVVTQPVSYGCTAGEDGNGNGTGQLWRYSGYDFVTPQPTAAPSTGSASMLADHLSACSFSLAGNQVEMQLTVKSGGEARTLQSVARIPVEW